MYIQRLSKWYGAIVWFIVSVIGALLISWMLGATHYVENWLGSMFKLTSAAWLAHWIARDLLGSPDETPALIPVQSLAQIHGADDTELMQGELLSTPSHNLTLARAIVIAAAMVAVCLAT